MRRWLNKHARIHKFAKLVVKPLFALALTKNNAQPQTERSIVHGDRLEAVRLSSVAIGSIRTTALIKRLSNLAIT
jgi:hypothetical protein